LNDHYPTDKTECMTAVGLQCRLVGRKRANDRRSRRQHADLLLKALPEWGYDGRTNDIYYLYFGTAALVLYGGNSWKAWSSGIRDLAENRGRFGVSTPLGCRRGSWDPNGPWGYFGGRVYSTALMVSSLAMVYR
jgi:hypothetical protein